MSLWATSLNTIKRSKTPEAGASPSVFTFDDIAELDSNAPLDNNEGDSEFGHIKMFSPGDVLRENESAPSTSVSNLNAIAELDSNALAETKEWELIQVLFYYFSLRTKARQTLF